MGELALRDYQEEAVLALLEAVARGEHPVCAMATGGGKSLVIAELCRRLPGRILVATHRKELLAQNSAQLSRLSGEEAGEIGVYSAGLGRRETDARVIFGGIQSIYRRMPALQKVGPFGTIIVDEAHLVGDRVVVEPAEDEEEEEEEKPPPPIPMYGRVFEACPDARRIGLSATPYRLDDGPIFGRPETWFDTRPVDIGIRYLTDLGHLAPLIGVMAAPDIDLSKVRVRNGDYVASDLSAIMSDQRVVNQAVEEMVVLAAKRQQWLAFCCDVTHTRIVTGALCAAGIDARLLIGTTPQDERDELLRAFRAREFRCLVNCQVATTGFDIPGIDCIVLLRPTKSKSLLVQMLGRGTRKYTGKTDCLLLDYADVLKHHMPLDEVPVLQEARMPPPEIPEDEEKDEDALRAKKIHAKHASSALPNDSLHQRKYAVRFLTYSVTPSKKVPGTFLLRVGYRCPERGQPWINTWLCVEYSGWPRLQAEAWFARRGLTCPASAAEALKIAKQARKPHSILLEEDARFPKIQAEYFAEEESEREF